MAPMSCYLCPLSVSSRFCLTRPPTLRQRNSNANTEPTDEATSCFEDAMMTTPSVAGISPCCQLPDTPQAARNSNGKHVDFASCDSVITATSRSQSRSSSARQKQQQLLQQLQKQQQQQQQQQQSWNASVSLPSSSSNGNSTGSSISPSDISCVPRLRQRRTDSRSSQHRATVTTQSLLVPLTCNQSNLLNQTTPPLSPPPPPPQREPSQSRLEQRSFNNFEQTTPDGADSSADRSTGGGGAGGGPCDVGDGGRPNRELDLLRGSGVPYWNVYEYADFRELQHGQSHVFDPQTDSNLHREGIILDNYNRLRESFSHFRQPVPMYHLR